jgi:hypothetical protein
MGIILIEKENVFFSTRQYSQMAATAREKT